MPLSELSRRERKKEETRRRIFDVAVELFRANGFEATTVDEITEKADVGRGTFFNYFPRKEAVLAYLSESRLEIAEEHTAALLTEARPVREKLLDLFQHAVSAYEEDRDLSRFVFMEWMKRGFAPTREVEERWNRLAIAILAQGCEKRELRCDVPAERAEVVLSGVYISTLYQWLNSPEECASPITDLRSELAARLDIVLDGLTLNAGAR